jgi:hypothetical protein
VLKRLVGRLMRTKFFIKVPDDCNANGIRHVAILNNPGFEQRGNRGGRVRRKVTEGDKPVVGC